jgi:hypothetical protein
MPSSDIATLEDFVENARSRGAARHATNTNPKNGLRRSFFTICIYHLLGPSYQHVIQDVFGRPGFFVDFSQMRKAG